MLGAALLLAACAGAEAEPAAQRVQSAAAAPATATATATTVRPPVVVRSASAASAPATAAPDEDKGERPSFAPADPTAVSAAQAAADATATATVTPEATAVSSLTATPPPTFTPPALPYTSADEHFWLRRPVPEGGAVWTDKAYPYGSTRSGSLRPHHGVEFYVPAGTEILAAASGEVIVAGSDAETVYGPHPDFYGNLVIVELDSRYRGQPVYNLYAHLSEILVGVGQRVEAQELIALSGASGVADGPHLHFEVRVGQNTYDSTRNPLLWLYPFPEHGVVAGRVTWPNGSPAQEAPVTLRRVDASSKYHGTTSYAGESVNGDDQWGENFAFDDVKAGYYEVEVKAGDEKYTEEVWVFPYQTSFVEIELDG